MDASAVRRALLDHGFTAASVVDVLGADAFDALGRGRPAAARHRLARSPATHLTDLIRLFLLGESLPRERVAALLPPDAVALRLIDRAGERPLVQIQPYPTGTQERFVVSDFGAGRGPTPAHLSPDHVIGVGSASVTLAAITPRDDVARTLDLGTGCGIEAVLAAPHSGSVVATDISGRALAYAALTAALSGVAVDLRRGSLFEPVAGEQFDLIVANPPFVMAPSPRLVYREAAHRGDDLTRDVVAGAAAHLAPGGTAVMLGNWLHLPDQPWQERLAHWAPTDCQMWVVQREFLTCAQYVELWLQDSGEVDADTGRFAQWLAYLADLGAEGIGFGWVVLRRADPQWFVAEDLAEAPELPTGAQIGEAMDRLAALQHLGALDLLASRPRWSPQVELHRWWSPAGATPELLEAHGAWRPAEQVDPRVAELVRAQGSLADRIEGLAAEHDPDDLTVAALLGLRRLYGAGLVDLD